MRATGRGAAREAVVGFAGGLQTPVRIGGHHERIEGRIDRVDAREMGLDHLATRDCPTHHQSDQFVRGQLAEVRHC
ncbi:hypothetical protein [Mycolicibacterium celeriflavum]|uniref:hypothetical protein n=1 Tax=Mycolicibacterium celeriflavum TaxID=1249101 RepID=UPI003CF04E18